jgi:two-component system cell cycle response regulator
VPAWRRRIRHCHARHRFSRGFEIAERIRSAIASDGFTVAVGGHPIAVTVSAGLAESAGDSSAALLRRADRALYRSKQDGRNRVSVDHARD